jgi:hypothetical protein
MIKTYKFFNLPTMGHWKNQKATESDDKIKRALVSISSGEYRTPYQAAKVLGLSEATLQQRIKVESSVLNIE